MLQVRPGPAGLAGRPCLLQHDHKHAGAAAALAREATFMSYKVHLPP